MKLSRIALAVALTPSLALAAQPVSQEQALKLSDTLITASRAVEQRSDSSAASTVFTRADIERLRPASVPQLLTQVPGVQVGNYGGRGGVYGLYVRGTSTAQTLVLVDGVRMDQATSAGAALQFLNIDQIERVEVLRGPRSAIHGADALGGVIQIFTRRGDGPGLQPRLRIAAGSDSTFERTLGLSGGSGRTRFNLSAGLEETAGIDRTRNSVASDADDDAYRNRSLALSVSHRFTDSLEAGLTLLDQRGKTEWDSTWYVQPYDDYSVSTSSLWVEGHINELWNTRIELGHSENKQEYLQKASAYSETNNTYRDSVNWLNTITLNDSNSVMVGVDYLNDKVRSSYDFTEDRRDNKAVFIQHSFQGQRFGTEIGMRHDDNEQFGSENTFNGAVSYQVNSDNQLILSYSEGFRAPNFTDLYWPDYCDQFGCFSSANQDLKAESSKSHELQWRSQFSESSEMEASVYRTDIEDAIVFTDIPRNVQKVRIHGFEASFRQALFGWQGELGVSIIDPRDRDSGQTLSNRAKRTLNMSLDRQFDAVGIGATFIAASKSKHRHFGAPASDISGYGRLDLRASWQANSEMGFDLTIVNVLDKDYSRLAYLYDGNDYGYPEQPLAAMLGFTWTPDI